MSLISKLCSGTFLVIGFIAGAWATPTRADVVIDWNVKADEIAVEKQTPPTIHGRGLAMLHVAMFEAVNAIQSKYEPYKLTLTANPNASREAAAASAGHDVLVALYPDLKLQLDATLATMLGSVPDGQAKSDGIAVGQKAAAGIMALRENDGVATRETYRPRTAPGVYVP